MLAYIIGIALGDGNLSNPNGRAVRLRITCDTRYPLLIKKIVTALQKLFPNNKVSLVKGGKKSYLNISCYSNQWESLLGWKAKQGNKCVQNVSIPEWIKQNKKFSINCLRGLIETDGSIYQDRTYTMLNFVTVIPRLAEDVLTIMTQLGFVPHLYNVTTQHRLKYTVRLSKKVPEFIKLVNCIKA